MRDGWQILPFENVILDQSGGNIKTPQSEFLQLGEFPIVDQGKSLISGYTNDSTRVCKVKLPVIIFGDHTRCLKFIDFPFGMGADGVKVLRPSINADEKYLFHYLQNLQLPNHGYDRHFKYLKRTDIVLPPIDQQKRIAAILDKAEELRRLRRQSIEHLDVLSRSIFIEMFGDPVVNPKAWKKCNLSKIAIKITDREHLNPIFSLDGMPIIMAGNVLEYCIDFQNSKKVEIQLGQQFRKKCKPEIGDILLVSRGATIGRLCAVKSSKEFCLMGSVILIKIDNLLVTSKYLEYLLKHPLMYLKMFNASGSSAQQAIYLKDLKQLECLLPPLPLQQEFAQRIEAIESLKAKHRESLTHLDTLFASLQHRAFRGEL